MTFLENAYLPQTVRFGLSGGPEFATRIVEVQSGAEQRAAAWSVSRGRWQADWGPYDTATKDALIDFFRSVKGRLIGFRFKDPADYLDAGRGVLGAAGVGTGLPAYQLTKRYAAGALFDARPIRKPVAGTIAVQRGGVGVGIGTGPGQVQVDATTGIVTFAADVSASIARITAGADTTVQLSASIGVAVGGRLYLSGLSGPLGDALNGRAWPVSAVSGATYTLAVGTAGLTGSGGIAARYPQPTETLTYTGRHDTPVRFDTDRLDIRAVDRGAWDVQGLVLVEIRQ